MRLLWGLRQAQTECGCASRGGGLGHAVHFVCAAAAGLRRRNGCCCPHGSGSAGDGDAAVTVGVSLG